MWCHNDAMVNADSLWLEDSGQMLWQSSYVRKSHWDKVGKLDYCTIVCDATEYAKLGLTGKYAIYVESWEDVALYLPSWLIEVSTTSTHFPEAPCATNSIPGHYVQQYPGPDSLVIISLSKCAFTYSTYAYLSQRLRQ